jgi:hypothetical protein
MPQVTPEINFAMRKGMHRVLAIQWVHQQPKSRNRETPRDVPARGMRAA